MRFTALLRGNIYPAQDELQPRRQTVQVEAVAHAVGKVRRLKERTVSVSPETYVCSCERCAWTHRHGARAAQSMQRARRAPAAAQRRGAGRAGDRGKPARH